MERNSASRIFLGCSFVQTPVAPRSVRSVAVRPGPTAGPLPAHFLWPPLVLLRITLFVDMFIYMNADALCPAVMRAQLIRVRKLSINVASLLGCKRCVNLRLSLYMVKQKIRAARSLHHSDDTELPASKFLTMYQIAYSYGGSYTSLSCAIPGSIIPLARCILLNDNMNAL